MEVDIIKNKYCRKIGNYEYVQVAMNCITTLFSSDGISAIEGLQTNNTLMYPMPPFREWGKCDDRGCYPYLFQSNKPYLAYKEIRGWGIMPVSVIYFTRINRKMVMLESNLDGR